MAVATQVEGFTTLGGMAPAFAFHAVVSIAGLQMLLKAAGPLRVAMAEGE